MPSGRSSEGGGDPRTPMAWQHRDLNYHQSGYQDRYGPGAEGPGRGGPPSSSDRPSHRTDRSWQQQQQAAAYSSTPQQHYPPRDYPTGRSGDYPPSHTAREYSQYSQRDQYPPQHLRDVSPSDHPQAPHHFSSHHQPGPSSRRPEESRHSATATSTISSSSSSGGEDSEEQVPPPQMMPPMGPGHPAFGGGYNSGYYPGYAPSQVGYAPSVAAHGGGAYHGGTIKSARSVPALLAATYDGEPCPVHHHGGGGGGGGMPPMSLPPVPMPMMHPGYATMGHPRRAASIYDMRVMSPAPPPLALYGTLPHPHLPPPPPDARSMGGSNLGGPLGIPAQLLPPMARPRPVVIGEGGGAPEVLPVRGGVDKGATLPKSLLASKAGALGNEDEKPVKRPFCCRGGLCVVWIILGVVVIGILLTLMLLFIL